MGRSALVARVAQCREHRDFFVCAEKQQAIAGLMHMAQQAAQDVVVPAISPAPDALASPSAGCRWFCSKVSVSMGPEIAEVYDFGGARVAHSR
eukprot:9501368-Pyramimonas_sp.AAC.1